MHERFSLFKNFSHSIMAVFCSQRYKEMSEAQLKQWATEYQAFLETLPDREEYLKQLKTIRGSVGRRIECGENFGFSSKFEGLKNQFFCVCDVALWRIGCGVD